MKLSQIVDYKNYLEETTPVEATPIAHAKLAPILHSVKSNAIQFTHLTERLAQHYQDVLNSIDEFDQTIDAVKGEITGLISQLEPTYYKESYRLYSQEMIHDSDELILNRRFNLTADVLNFITARILNHGDWHHAGMIIRPGHEEWITHLVGCDPLYLVDTRLELIEPAVLRFNDQYRRRLRTYAVDESVTDPILDRLPNGQFGYCLVYNYFNYKPFEIVAAYLTEI